MTEQNTRPTWFGHPRGLSTLFFTEMWERFSYYGMRALLMLFMVDAIDKGGMGIDESNAGAIYGLYTAGVYLACLPGGWVADRLIGAQRSVLVGGIIITLGHFTLAIPSTKTFFIGLILVVVGTGFLKPNVSTIVGQLYPEGGARRDAGFTVFYMGINLGAMVGSIVCSELATGFSWHMGFAAAGVGMVFGVIQFVLTSRHLGGAGSKPEGRPNLPEGEKDPAWYLLWGAGLGVLILMLIMGGVINVGAEFNALSIAQYTTYVIVGIAAIFFFYVFVFGKLNSTEAKRTVVILILFVASAVFWSGFEQAGSSLNLFADRHTDRVMFGKEISAGSFQSLNPFFIITLAPLFAAMWVRLAKKQLDPSMPAKFAIGLLLLAAGFLVMVFAAKLVVAGKPAAPYWLVLTYLLHTMGELCLSPVGLSSVTKLAPQRFVGQMMGIWFLGGSLGNLIAGLVAGRFSPDQLTEMPNLFLQIVLISGGAGLFLLLFTKPVKSLMGDVK
ncbi:MAG: MFS transporter [Verrucomicrobiales bacterium]|nr:MFS transporter [Verrucomicrobiales bacterium]|tara:strand:- start:8854 stop:10350 length:1497 start_codon:yes stop_codon:yes gene_type:complete